MPSLAVTFSDEELAALDELAEREYGGDRDRAASALLDDWIDGR